MPHWAYQKNPSLIFLSQQMIKSRLWKINSKFIIELVCINCRSLPVADITCRTRIFNFHENGNKVKYVTRIKKNWLCKIIKSCRNKIILQKQGHISAQQKQISHADTWRKSSYLNIRVNENQSSFSLQKHTFVPSEYK